MLDSADMEGWAGTHKKDESKWKKLSVASVLPLKLRMRISKIP